LIVTTPFLIETEVVGGAGGSVEVVVLARDTAVVPAGATVDVVLGAALSVGVLESEHAAIATAPRRSATNADVLMRSERTPWRWLSGRGLA
jgi:hypothetical protein